MLLNKSAEQGNAEAQYRLGLILYEGKLVEADRVEPGQWTLLAAAAGNAGARRLFKEMQLFLTTAEMAEARKQADGFKPVKQPTASPPPTPPPAPPPTNAGVQAAYVAVEVWRKPMAGL